MKILVVDDEELICEWLEFCIAQDARYELVGIARNGRDAMELFKAAKPDLVLTDIRMPVMDGLALLHEVKAARPDTVVVMLTAFSEFDLARQAMREGAAEYLLKSELSREVFLETLSRLEEQWAARTPKPPETGEGPWRSQSVIKSVLTAKGDLSEEDIRRLRRYNLRWRDSGLFAIALWKTQVLADFAFPQSDDIRHVAGFEYDELVFVAVGNLPREAGARQRTAMLNGYLSALAAQNGCMVGASRIGESMKGIRDLVGQAAAALATGFYDGRAKVYRHEALPPMASREAEWERWLQQRYRHFCAAAPAEARQSVEQTLAEVEAQRVWPVRLVENYCALVMGEAFGRAMGAELGLGRALLPQARAALAAAGTFAEKRAALLDFFAEYARADSVDESALSPGVRRAVAFIRAQYAGPITLEQVADEVGLNAEYLSRLFKEEVGQTYSAFLTGIRLKRAARLLAHTNEKVQKIGLEVGYPNVSYFSTLFKKNYGLNPFEYRRGNFKEKDSEAME